MWPHFSPGATRRAIGAGRSGTASRGSSTRMRSMIGSRSSMARGSSRRLRAWWERRGYQQRTGRGQGRVADGDEAGVSPVGVRRAARQGQRAARAVGAGEAARREEAVMARVSSGVLLEHTYTLAAPISRSMSFSFPVDSATDVRVEIDGTAVDPTKYQIAPNVSKHRRHRPLLHRLGDLGSDQPRRRPEGPDLPRHRGPQAHRLRGRLLRHGARGRGACRRDPSDPRGARRPPRSPRGRDPLRR